MRVRYSSHLLRHFSGEVRRQETRPRSPAISGEAMSILRSRMAGKHPPARERGDGRRHERRATSRAYGFPQACSAGGADAKGLRRAPLIFGPSTRPPWFQVTKYR